MLSHRGPDAEGILAWDEKGRLLEGDLPDDQDLVMGLGHRRLAIFDLSDAGLQPMKGTDGEWIVYNGEIYNFPEIRDELKGFGHSFSTQTDVEVVLRAYSQWGTSCVTHFNGMWAFAIFDPVRKGFFCSRDRMGIKPFYYYYSADLFCFASEVQPIFCCTGKDPEIDEDQLARYLLFHEIDDGCSTIYANVRELRGGYNCWIDKESGSFRTWQFWCLPEQPNLNLSDKEALCTFTDLFEDSVRLRLRADVPVAVTLSGGIDSSAVVVAASKVGSHEIQTFTSRFPNCPKIDESHYAAEVAKACGVRATYVTPDLTRLLEEEPLLTQHQAMPYGSLSLYVHWAILSCIKREGVPVVLSGQGGDELFLGYERYYVPQILSLFPNLPRLMLAGVLAGLRSRLGLRGIAAYLAYFGFPRFRLSVLRRRARRVFRPDLVARAVSLVRGGETDMRSLQKVELQEGQLSRLLRYDDRTSGAHGMETRLPFLDFRLVEFAYRLPWNHKIRNGWTKYLVRRYLEQNGLPSIAWRRHKLGFDAPTNSWTQQLVREKGSMLLDHPFAKLLLREDVSLAELRPRELWNVYNILHLAASLKWKGFAASSQKMHGS